MPPTKWAILIACNFYLSEPHATGPDIARRDLCGCINDITGTQRYLRERHGLQDNQIRILSASGPHTAAKDQPRESPSCWPTYDNIIAVLKETTAKANARDLVYIHYSGHGARVPTIYEDLKGIGAWDEAFVPVDRAIGGRLVHDIEMAALLHGMLTKGLLVTVVLDCCHSGGATRTGEVEVDPIRGLNEDDPILLQQDKPEGFIKELQKNDASWIEPAMRNSVDRQHWLLRSVGYTLLASCRPQERAGEFRHHDGKRFGRLTHLLLAILSGPEKDGWPMSHQRLHDVITAKFSALGYSALTARGGPQNPVLIGGGKASFFGSSTPLPAYASCVIKTDSGGLIRLNIGKAHGICVGTQYTVFPLETSADASRDRSQSIQLAIATVTVFKVDDLSSEARLPSNQLSELPKIEVGCQAKLLTHILPKSVHVRFVQSSRATYQAKQELKAKLESLTSHGIPLKLEDDEDTVAAAESLIYQVDIDKDEYVVRNKKEAELNLPPLRLQETDSKALVTVIQHLAKFHLISDLRNIHPMSKLRDKFSFSVHGRAADTNNAVIEVSEDDQIFVNFENKYTDCLHLTVFDLTPRRAVQRIWPQHSYYSSVDAGKTEVLPFAMEIPESLKATGVKSIIDTLLALVTVEPVTFEALQMPNLEEALNSTKMDRFRANVSFTSLASMLDFLQPMRDVVPRAVEIKEWQTAKIVLRTSARDEKEGS